jgi:hypothetical protein
LIDKIVNSNGYAEKSVSAILANDLLLKFILEAIMTLKDKVNDAEQLLFTILSEAVLCEYLKPGLEKLIEQGIIETLFNVL